MRRGLLVGLSLVVASGCNFGIKTCETAAECEAGAECRDGFCVIGDGGTTGGGGGSTGGGGGSTGGGGGSTGGGTGGGSMSYCDAGLSCRGWEECEPSASGGRCADAEYSFSWTAPGSGTLFGSGQTRAAQVQVTKRDGGVVRLSSVPVTGVDVTPTSLTGSTGSYSGSVGPLLGADGMKTIVAGWPDAGRSGSLQVELDTQGPGFDVQVLGQPTYTSDSGLLLVEPGDPSAVKKDETVTIRVTSMATDVNPASVALSVSANGQAWDAGVGMSCGAAAFCRDFTLALGPQPLNAFSASVDTSVAGADGLNNPGSANRLGLFRVTRWKWARQVVASNSSLKASPAIGQGGDLWLGNAIAAGQGLYRVSPTGAVTHVWDGGVIEASPAIGMSGSTEYVFYLPVNSPVLRVGGVSNCGTPATANLGSLAIINDGMATMRALGVTGSGTGSQILAFNPVSGCSAQSSEAAGVGELVFPGNVIVSGSSIWYPESTGIVKRFSYSGSFTASSDITGIAAGTIYGLAAYGANLAGGGGAGVGRLFVRAADGSGTTSGYNMSRHVSGVSVGRVSNQDVLFAVTQETGGAGVLRRFDSTGAAQDVVTWPGGFNFTFPASVPGGTTPVLGAGGYVYVVGNNGAVAAADQSTLDLRWTKALPGAVSGSVLASATLDCNRDKPASGTGVYYFATSDGWLVGYIVDSAGLDQNAAWPKYQHDARNTGNLGASKACP